MKEEKPLKFSVAVICYKRKDFIIEALKSVLQQDFPREEIQIVVVKAFYDQEIDNFIEKNGIESVFSDSESYGKSVSDALSLCDGDVICLLDDDDLFKKEKLRIIYSVFHDNPQLALVVNNYDIIDENSRKVDSKFHSESRQIQHNLGFRIYDPNDARFNTIFRHLQLNFNSSRMCFRRNIIENYKEVIPKILYLVDEIPPLLSVISGRPIATLPDELTSYRIHKSNVSLITSQEEKMQKFFFSHRKMMSDYDTLRNFIGERGDLSIFYSIAFSYEKMKLALVEGRRSESLSEGKELLGKLVKGFRQALLFRRETLSIGGLLLNLSFLPVVYISPKAARRIRILFPL
ncbi:MAG: glycosyltransferase [Candidatus Parvarchaeota archaeon]